MDNFFEKLIQETDNAYFKKVEEMFDKTNAEQYYQFLKEALKESWDKKKVLSLIPDKFINEYPDLYFKLFEKDLQTEIPEKFYMLLNFQSLSNHFPSLRTTDSRRI